MTDANNMHDINMRELDDVVLPDADETTEQHKSFSFHEREVICDRENEENNTSTDTRLLPAPTVTEALFTYNVSVYPNNEELLQKPYISVLVTDEAGMDDYMESEKHLAFQEGTIEISLNEEEINKGSDYKAEQDKVCCEEMKREEQKRHRERKFQEELKKIMEAEKVHQKELELMEKTAQEKREQEFLLQQELITNLQRRVEEERRKREEEQKRMKDEEGKQKREEEKNKIEAERKRMEEETRRKKREEERKIEEVRCKKEEERKNVEEKKKIMEREEKRKREEERNKIDLEKKKLEDEMRMMKEEEKRKKKEEVERTKKKEEEERKRIEEMRKEVENKRKTEKQMSLNEVEWQEKEEEERKNREQKNMRTEEETEEKKKQEEMKRKKEEKEEADERKNTAQKKMCENIRTGNKEQHRYVDEEIKLEATKKKEESKRKEEEVDEKQEARKREKKRKKMEEKKEVREVVRKQEGGDSNMEEELRPMEEDERRKKEEEQRSRQDEIMRQIDEERKSEIMRLDKDGNKGHDVDYRKIEQENKTKIKEMKQKEEEKRKRVERKKSEAEKEQNVEEVERETEGSKKRTPAQGKEVRINEVREKKENESMVGQNEKNKTENFSQLKDCHTRTSSSPDPLHGASATCYTRTEARPQQHDLHKNVSQTSPDKNQEVTSSTTLLLPVCLPEHTEKKRLSWMNDCVSWTKLSLQNRRKQKGSVKSHRGPRRAAEASSLPPLCPDFLLQYTGWKSLQQVTTLTLEDLPGCSLSTLAQCTRLQSLSLRCCGLKSLEGLNHLSQLCYINVQENDISFINCENMMSLRVLRLSHNKLTSIHGLTGVENLDILDLSHNFITRIAGLESVRRLQRLLVDHNQLISTKGLRDVYTLLHLNCSYNHLASVEGLESSALLNTLDLRANSLTEVKKKQLQLIWVFKAAPQSEQPRPPQRATSRRQQHLLFAEPHCLLAAPHATFLCGPKQNYPAALHVRLRVPCKSGSSIQLHIRAAEPLCESGGMSFLARSSPHRESSSAGEWLGVIFGFSASFEDGQPGNMPEGLEYNPDLCRREQVSLASGNFLMFCQAQLQQTHDLQQQHSREHSDASSPLDAAKTSCRHFTEVLQLATDQRFAHEYGDTTVPNKHTAAGQTIPEETLDMDRVNAEKHAEHPEMDSTEESAAESRHDTLFTATTDPRTVPTVWKANSGSVHSVDTKINTVAKHQNLDLQKEKCGNISSPSTAEKGGVGGDGEKPESGPSYINGSVVGQDYAATVIQAWWKGFSLRKRLTSALAAVTCLDTGEDDTFEEVDVDEFVFDERAQNMRSKKQQLKKCRDPSVRLSRFKNQPGPVEARSRQAQHNRNYTKARETKVGLHQAEKTERVKRERAQQCLHTQAAHSDRDSESEHFLPEISSDVLNGGRVQLVADPGYTEHLHHASGLWANSSSAAQPCKQNNYLRENSLGHTREEVPSPKRVTSAPSKKERLSFRDNPVQMSGGWGGGRKRDKVYK
ncbi:Leucine-rich repeat and IQ domain-containing protein 1 [Collichthys lucidus]|uniref:Leucine-rich repeat and IQ domain-containing protein 1 n=1 Tax=Collichthys lucidus TaxID=240159 RepID=A0A4V6ARK9_COLLU|nr:Leucine-rich repeat and IQ domain-containing protein 1 [Collichthys lucidus]